MGGVEDGNQIGQRHQSFPFTWATFPLNVILGDSQEKMSSFKVRVKYRGNVLIAFIPDGVTTSWAEKNNFVHFYGHLPNLKIAR